MNLVQMALLELLLSTDASRVYVESDGYGDELRMTLSGDIPFRHADLKEMVRQGVIHVSEIGRVSVTRHGQSALARAYEQISAAGPNFVRLP